MNGGQTKEYFSKYREDNRKIIREKSVIKSKIARELVFQALGAECVKCGFNDKRALQIDHINGGGCIEKKIFRNSYNYYTYVLNVIKSGEKKYQILCANCNWIKRIINKE